MSRVRDARKKEHLYACADNVAAEQEQLWQHRLQQSKLGHGQAPRNLRIHRHEAGAECDKRCKTLKRPKEVTP